MTKITFEPGGWEKSGLTHAYSWRFDALPVFRQGNGCIENGRTPDGRDYDYMGLITGQDRSSGSSVSVRCGFEELGAPMLLVSLSEETDGDGMLRLLEYYEIVIWKHGLNVWRHYTDLASGRKTSHKLILGAEFPLACGEPHLLSCGIREGRMLLAADEHRFDLFIQDLTGPVRLGYAACEGICRLYEMTLGDPGDN